MLDCPGLRTSYNTALDTTINGFFPGTYNNFPTGHRKSWLESLLGKTKMTPEQARNASNLLTTGGIAAGIFFLGRWLFTGKGIDGKKNEKLSFFGRLGI